MNPSYRFSLPSIHIDATLLIDRSAHGDPFTTAVGIHGISASCLALTNVVALFQLLVRCRPDRACVNTADASTLPAPAAALSTPPCLRSLQVSRRNAPESISCVHQQHEKDGRYRARVPYSESEWPKNAFLAAQPRSHHDIAYEKEPTSQSSEIRKRTRRTASTQAVGALAHQQKIIKKLLYLVRAAQTRRGPCLCTHRRLAVRPRRPPLTCTSCDTALALRTPPPPKTSRARRSSHRPTSFAAASRRSLVRLRESSRSALVPSSVDRRTSARTHPWSCTHVVSVRRHLKSDRRLSRS
ncbi:hypothetical protein C8R45DRAFT_269097 [Mycena sanguinolenta]|nr:hypothetical protein C8R45DRAFT_269097 [Mycena sanguinolenta]